MRFRQICFGLALALGLPGFQAAAATLQVFGGPVGGGCNNFICYSGAPTGGTLRTTSGEAFMTYNASVNARGMFADFSIFGFAANVGTLDLRSTDVFTVNSIVPGGAATVDLTARLRLSGKFGVSDLVERGARGGARARAFFTAPRSVPGVTIIEESGKDVTVRLDLLEDIVVLPDDVGVDIESRMTLRVEVGRPFALETRMELNLGFSNSSDRASGGAAFGESALISFDLPEGSFITSQRGYSQGVPAIPLPAGGVLLLSALGMIGWVSRHRRLSLTA